MARRLEIYKCETCGNIVEVIEGSFGQLVCCELPMQLLEENTVDAAKEKHVPVIERSDKGFLVKIGEVQHPMEEKHYIQWIELVADGRSYTRFLNPGDTPEAFFCLDAEDVTAREFCNIHGLWKK